MAEPTGNTPGTVMGLAFCAGRFSVADHLTRLRTQGFKPLRPGKIHLRCPACGRKQSNMPRGPLDPPKAFLLEAFCDCTQGGKDDFGGYYDARGRYLCSYCGRHRCEMAAGNWRCTEALRESGSACSVKLRTAEVRIRPTRTGGRATSTPPEKAPASKAAAISGEVLMKLSPEEREMRLREFETRVPARAKEGR